MSIGGDELRGYERSLRTAAATADVRYALKKLVGGVKAGWLPDAHGAQRLRAAVRPHRRCDTNGELAAYIYTKLKCAVERGDGGGAGHTWALGAGGSASGDACATSPAAVAPPVPADNGRVGAKKAAGDQCAASPPASVDASAKAAPPPHQAPQVDAGPDPFGAALALADSVSKKRKRKKRADESAQHKAALIELERCVADDVSQLVADAAGETETDTEAPQLNWASVLDTPVANYVHVPAAPPPRDAAAPAPSHRARQCTDTSYLDEALAQRSHQSRKQAVFSGRRRRPADGSAAPVPTLRDMALSVIAANLDELEDTGDIPFEILAPALQKATAAQLYAIEERNPTLWMEGDSEALWCRHVQRDFAKAEQPHDKELWRQYYQRLRTERERKLERLKSKLVAKINVPDETVRTAKLSEPVAPAHIKRKQIKYGTNVARAATAVSAGDISRCRRQMEERSAGTGAAARPSASTSGSDERQPAGTAIRAMMFAARQADSVGRSSRAKPLSHRAPMMQKSLRMFKRTKVTHR